MMEDKCIRCGNPAAFPIRALEIRTLHVRSLSGERRIQALGEQKEGAVCETCARAQLSLSRNAGQAARTSLIRFGAVFCAGLLVIACTLLLVRENRQVFILTGIAALICGILGCFDALRKAREKAAALAALPEADALKEAAWDVWLEKAPKKEDQDDLSYISIDEKTLRRKNGDLMILYGLPPEIAVQAWNRLHGKENIDDQTHRDVQNQG